MGLHDQQIYNPDDPKILQVQKQAQLKMYEYNQTLPTEDAKRQRLMKEMLGKVARVAISSHRSTPTLVGST